jgi:hypothetical protein
VQVGSIVNFALMYLLAPTAAIAGSGAAAVAAAATAAAAAGAGKQQRSLLVRALSEEFLVKWGAPSGNMFQAGFPLSKRLLNFVYKGGIFAVIGLLAGAVGTSISNGLITLRQHLDPSFVTLNT